MQPDIDALHNHITTLHITIGTQTDCQINMGMPHKSPISHSLQERLKRCCIKVLHNKSFLFVQINTCTMKVLGKETEIFLAEEDTSIFRFTIQYVKRFGYLIYLINGNFLRWYKWKWEWIDIQTKPSQLFGLTILRLLHFILYSS